MATVSFEINTEEKHSNRAQRSQAMPKQTLFGSNLQFYNDKDRQEIEDLDLKTLEEKENQERTEYRQRRMCQPRLPDHLQQHAPVDALQHTKDELAQQLTKMMRAHEMLSSLEQKAKYYQPTSVRNPASDPAGTQQWMEKATKMNKVGLEPHLNYDRHRYQKQAPAHQYSVIGDPLKTGMEWPSKDTPAAYSYSRPERRRAPGWLPKEAFMFSKKDKSDGPEFAVDLPPNIQHQFGTRVCASVLSDKQKVDNTLKDQKRKQASFLRTRSQPSALRPAAFESKADPVYESLSHSLRQNVFPGHAHNNKSLSKSTYTKDVYANRVPDPDVYRYQRDELSTWAEQNVLRERVKRAWDVYLTETLPKQS